MTREISIVDRIRDKINRSGGHVIKTHGDAYSSGQPDLMGCWKNGRMLVIEVKQPGKEPRPQQRANIEKWRSKGAIAFYEDSADGIIEKIEGIVNGRKLAGKYRKRPVSDNVRDSLPRELRTPPDRPKAKEIQRNGVASLSETDEFEYQS